MANNELSGPIVASYLAKALMERTTPLYYTYRFVFLPETIGSITYLSLNKDHLKEKVIAGYVVTCAGDPGQFSYLQTREENTLVDRVTMHTLKHSDKTHEVYDFSERGSDERHYNAPGIDLPVGSLMRTKYRDYPEYHTSGDNLELGTAEALEDTLQMYLQCVEVLENNHCYQTTVYCEPQLGKRGLYPTLSDRAFRGPLMDLVAYCDGKRDLLWIAEKNKYPVWDLFPVVKQLCDHDLLRQIDGWHGQSPTLNKGQNP